MIKRQQHSTNKIPKISPNDKKHTQTN